MNQRKLFLKLMLACIVFYSCNDAEIPDDWRAAWESPPAAMRPLQIIHGGMVSYDTPEKMAYFNDQCGLGGVVCNVGSRNYLYNDDEWKLFVDAVRSAKSLGLRVWIYDEDGYPSPQAGGVVLRGHPELECMSLVYDKDRKDNPFYIRPAYEFTHASNNFAAARRYPNPLHPEATRRFLEVTHQQYRDRLGTELFAYVEAFFTDEPSLNAMNIWQLSEEVRVNVRVDDPLDPNLKPLPMVIWCDDLPDRYFEKYGEDLLPVRKSLFEGDADNDKRIRRQFWELVSELNRDRYYGQIQEWCEANGSSVPTPESPEIPLRIASSGHMLCEEQTHVHVPFDGNKLEALMRMDVPGLDMLTSNPKEPFSGGWRAAAFPASAAWWTGRRLVMTEVSDFAEKMSGAGPADLNTMCVAAAWQAAMGVTEFTLYYNIKDRDEATHKKYCDYVGRLNAILRNAKPVYEVALHYPIAELQAEYVPMAEPLALHLMSQKTKELVRDFEESGRQLLQRQIPFVLTDKSPEGINKAGLLPVKTVADVQKISTDGMPKITPENSWIVLGRFERAGQDIFMLVNTGEEVYDGALVVPGKTNPKKWNMLDPATGEILPVGKIPGATDKMIPLKLQPEQALIYVCERGSLTAACGSDKLPKVVIAEDGRSFKTEDGKPFVPFGANYFRPGMGWAPQLWKMFDEAAFREDFALMKEAGVNCVRVFLSYGSFLTEKGKIDPEGLAKFDKFLEIAEDYGIYIHPTGLDHWEGPGALGDRATIRERYSDDEILDMTILFWNVFAARYKGRNVIFAYDLLNEPEIPWEAPSMKPKWNAWLKNRYQTAENFAQKRNIPLNSINWGNEEAPTDFSNRELILDYQHFREDIADNWTKIQVDAIKSVDPNALATVGLIQWSVPVSLPVPLRHYAAFRPSRQAQYLDFMEIHFYPLATGFYEYEKEGDAEKNLAYLESAVREVALTGKPVVIAEYGWYGGGRLKNSNQDKPAASEEQQAAWNVALVETTKGLAVGWLNWGFFDMPESNDISELLGLYTVDRRPKAWGVAFKQLSKQLSGQFIRPKTLGTRPAMDWDLLISDPHAAPKFQEDYLNAFIKGKK